MLGIIGGTSFYRLDGLSEAESRPVETPFGAPSAAVMVARLGGQPVVFLPRHGTSHELLPGEINYRANLWALKSVGVRRVVGVSAVGSLRETLCPGDLAIPSQYLDMTRGRRAHTFFGDGIVAHVSTAEPCCPQLAELIASAAEREGAAAHRDKVYACVEGPRLGTRAESRWLQAAGADLVGMTNVPEAFLAREAQLCYCTIAIVTDFDCWLEDPAKHANVADIMRLYSANIDRVQRLLAVVAAAAQPAVTCGCRSSLKGAVLSPADRLPDERRRILEFLQL